MILQLDSIASLAPSPSMAAGIVLAFLAGAAVPTYYAQERLRGFGRALADRLPYRPPPGMDADEALRAAAESYEDGETTEEDTNA